MNITLYEMAERFRGIKELPGDAHNAQILAILQRAASWVDNDEVAWCSAFVGYIMFLMGLPETKSLRARSWLLKGRAIPLWVAEKGDVVIFNRANGPDDPTIIDAPGHVGFFKKSKWGKIHVLGGNQSNTVNIARINSNRLLGVRRMT